MVRQNSAAADKAKVLVRLHRWLKGLPLIALAAPPLTAAAMGYASTLGLITPFFSPGDAIAAPIGLAYIVVLMLSVVASPIAVIYSSLAHGQRSFILWLILIPCLFPSIMLIIMLVWCATHVYCK